MHKLAPSPLDWARQSTRRKATCLTCSPTWPNALPPVTREERATRAKVVISTHFNSKQQVFLDFVLSHYVRDGVGRKELKLKCPLLD